MIKSIAKTFLDVSKNFKSNLPAVSKQSSKPIGTGQAIFDNLERVPVHVSDGVTSLVSEITDYLKIAEVEKSRRTEITAHRDIALKTLQNQRDTIKELMQYTFQERAAVLKKQFDVLDTAMSNGDVSTIKHALDGMVAVIQTSPFKSIQEMQTALCSKDFVVRLE